jgi:hypothetical protein
MFIGALCIIAKMGGKPKCPSAYEWISTFEILFNHANEVLIQVHFKDVPKGKKPDTKGHIV